MVVAEAVILVILKKFLFNTIDTQLCIRVTSEEILKGGGMIGNSPTQMILYLG